MGKAMCLLVPFIELTVSHTSVLTILAITVERSESGIFSGLFVSSIISVFFLYVTLGVRLLEHAVHFISQSTLSSTYQRPDPQTIEFQLLLISG